jgi:nucleotide-binding universal stress UspA family protein
VLPEIELAVSLSEPAAPLTLFDVVPDQGWTWNLLGGKADEIRRELKTKKETALSEIAGSEAARLGRPVIPIVGQGKTSIAVIKQVQSQQHDVVVMQAKGTHSRRVGGIGDTAWELLRKCPCPVLLIAQQEAATMPKKILVALDAAAEDPRHIELNRKIMAAAAHLAVKLNVGLTAIHCWAIYGESMVRNYMSEGEFRDIEASTRQLGEEGLQKLAGELTEKPRDFHLKLLRGMPNTHVPAYANGNDFDLVVMGTVARQGIAGALLGNTAEEVLPQLKSSILAIKPDGFVSPIS